MRNGCLYLLIRVGNLRTKSYIIETHVTAKVVFPKKITEEGEHIAFDQDELKVGCIVFVQFVLISYFPLYLFSGSVLNSP